jgi:hypothetical protein
MAAAKHGLVGRPTRSCLDPFDLAGFRSENRIPLFGNPAYTVFTP